MPGWPCPPSAGSRPLSPEEVADLKLAITEAANDFVDDGRSLEDESRVNFNFRLLDDRLLMELDGPASPVAAMEQELSRAIIDATVDECAFGDQHTRLVKYLATAPSRLPRAMLQPIAVGHKSLADYTHLAGKPLIEDIRELAKDLEGLKVLHLSATAFGGGVAEILYTLIPLMNDVGVEAEWQVMLGREEFYNVTKRLHNALQGNPDSLSEEEWEIFERYNALNATEISERMGRDHRPRPAAGRHPASTCRRRAATGSGAATSTCPLPNPDAVDHLVPLVREYDNSVFHLQDYVPAGHGRRRATACGSARPRSTRSRPRTWRSRPRTPPSCATSSASTWTARSCARSRASIPGRTRWG